MRTCKECNIIFESGRSYSNHVRWKHNNKVYERFICKHCNKNFAKCGIKRHQSLCDMSPNKKRKCKQCSEFVSGYRKLFCNRSCSATYNNTHKTYGTRRSKLEIYIEKKLIEKYPYIEFVFNKKDAIKSELDIYIPQLNIAFEINGIYHYKNIHGPTLLQRIQINDALKIKACKEKNILLYTIDTSMLSTFNEKAAISFFNKITDIINQFYALLV